MNTPHQPDSHPTAGHKTGDPTLLSGASRAQFSYLNIANLVSLVRLVLLPVYFYFLIYYLYWQTDNSDPDLLTKGYYFATITLVPIILFTDFLDGWLARRFCLVNPLGAFLDPLADKFFAFFTMVVLSWGNVLPLWLTMVVFFKEAFILTGWVLLFILGYDTAIEPNRIGKSASVCQGVVILTALVSLPDGAMLDLPGLPLYTLAEAFHQSWFHILTAVLTTLAGGLYVLEGLRRSQPTPIKSRYEINVPVECPSEE